MGIILSIVLGATLIRRTTTTIEQLVATTTALDTGKLHALQGQLMGLNVLNLLILLSTVGAMVFKPTL